MWEAVEICTYMMYEYCVCKSLCTSSCKSNLDHICNMFFEMHAQALDVRILLTHMHLQCKLLTLACLPKQNSYSLWILAGIQSVSLRNHETMPIQK